MLQGACSHPVVSVKDGSSHLEAATSTENLLMLQREHTGPSWPPGHGEVLAGTRPPGHSGQPPLCLPVLTQGFLSYNEWYPLFQAGNPALVLGTTVQEPASQVVGQPGPGACAIHALGKTL